jgi:hypothetical protein
MSEASLSHDYERSTMSKRGAALNHALQITPRARRPMTV